jgi:uncharacterized membrane protein (DUF373 family)
MPAGPDKTFDIADTLGIMESAVYLLVSVFLVAMTLLTLFQVATDLSGFNFTTATTNDILPAIQDLLTTLILAELIQTVAVYLKSHKLDIKLILAAGLTAMIRRVLVSGVETLSPSDMAVTGILMLVLIIAIYIVGERKLDIRYIS